MKKLLLKLKAFFCSLSGKDYGCVKYSIEDARLAEDPEEYDCSRNS